MRGDDDLTQPGKIVILAEPDDTLALCVGAELERRHGGDAVLLASSAELSCARRFCYRDADGGSEASGRPASSVELANGRRIDSATSRVVWCRLRWLALPQFAGAHDDDRQYAQMESFALLLAWLQGLPCPVVPRPEPRGLAGASWSRWELARAASAAGLTPRAVVATTSARRPLPEATRTTGDPFEPHAVRLFGARAHPAPGAVGRHELGAGPALLLERLGPERATAVVIGEGDGRVLGDAPPELAPAIRRLARGLRSPLLQVSLGRAAGACSGQAENDWRVDDATAFVSALRDDVIFALADCFDDLKQGPRPGAATGDNADRAWSHDFHDHVEAAT
jgi:hypothetical protein